MPLKDPILRKLYKSQWHLKNRERLRTKKKAYRSTHREEIAKRKRDYYFTHREEISAYKRSWHFRNKARLNQKSHSYYLNNRHRCLSIANNRKQLMKLRGQFSRKNRRYILNQFNFRCLRCHRYGGKLVVDHIVPISRGGVNTIKNRQLLCDSCNRWKGRKIIDYRPKSSHIVNGTP